MLKLLLITLLLFIFNGCTTKTEVIEKQTFICVEFLKVDISDEVKIRVYKSDIALFSARKKELNTAIEFYENQIDKYNLLCKDVENGK